MQTRLTLNNTNHKLLLVTEFKLFIECFVSRLVLLQNNNNDDTLKILNDVLREHFKGNF